MVYIKNLLVHIAPIYYKFIAWKLRYKETINIVFFASSISMWRYQYVYEALSQISRFRTYIVIQPAFAYSDEQQSADVNSLINYFNSKKIPYLLATDENGNYLDIRKEISPDVLFYPQPYNNFYPESVSYNAFYDKLLCYMPYAFWTSKYGWSYNQPLHKLAWKLFYSTELHRQDAILYSLRGDSNVEVVGYPNADDFLFRTHLDGWKKQNAMKKRLIWAPHFTIVSGDLLYQSNFLWMSYLMIELAQKYSDRIQFVFKPHPRLYTELCKHPDWGEQKAKDYYRAWETMENTQIETGEFVDLFMTSDAMIHDCGSFAVEYHYSENPVMYVAQNFEAQLEEKNEFGKLAMKQHYVGKTKEDIRAFIEDVVLAGNDPMKPGRQQFKKDYLLPPNGKTVAENTMEVFLKAFC